MKKASGLILTAGLIVVGAGRSSGQMFPPTGQGQVPPAMAEMQKAMAELTKETSPELYAFQEQLRSLDEKIMKIVKSFSNKEIDRKAARAAILPLVKEQKAIQNNPDFLVEQRLMQAYFSSPEYQAKAKAIREKMNAQQQHPPVVSSGPVVHH